MSNTSGFEPLGDKVLIKTDKQPNKKEGIIEIPDTVQERHIHGQVTGVLVAIGDGCTDYWKTEWFAKKAPSAGERVLYSRYAGLGFKGADGAQYRVLNARDVTGWASDGLVIE